ncbi:hypothetical protein ACJ5NV_19135 [Loktanella agnita]|uniref:hypothetical protein n=1 Tax=Loktanella agnita TaxID=287097 RepID=UPI0039892989
MSKIVIIGADGHKKRAACLFPAGGWIGIGGAFREAISIETDVAFSAGAVVLNDVENSARVFTRRI